MTKCFSKSIQASVFLPNLYLFTLNFPIAKTFVKLSKKKNLYSFTLKLTKTKTFASLSERVAQQKILPEAVLSKYIETGTLN